MASAPTVNETVVPGYVRMQCLTCGRRTTRPPPPDPEHSAPSPNTTEILYDRVLCHKCRRCTPTSSSSSSGHSVHRRRRNVSRRIMYAKHTPHPDSGISDDFGGLSLHVGDSSSHVSHGLASLSSGSHQSDTKPEGFLGLDSLSECSQGVESMVEGGHGRPSTTELPDPVPDPYTIWKEWKSDMETHACKHNWKMQSAPEIWDPPPFAASKYVPKFMKCLIPERLKLLEQIDNLRISLRRFNVKGPARKGKEMYDDVEGGIKKLRRSIYRLQDERERLDMRVRRHEWYCQNPEWEGYHGPPRELLDSMGLLSPFYMTDEDEIP